MKNVDSNLKSKNESKAKKYIPIIIIAFVFFIGVIGYILNSFYRYDAEIPVNDDDITISIKGEYNGYASADASFRLPADMKIKSADKTKKVYDYLSKIKPILNKEKNIKNGDKIVATFELKSPDNLKIKFDKDKISKEITVKGLKDIVASYTDIPNNKVDLILKESDEYMRNKLSSSSYENVNIERIKIYESRYNHHINNIFELVVVYKTSFDKKSFFEDKKHMEQYRYTVISNFRKKDDAITYSDPYEQSYYYYDSLEKLEDYLKVSGYEEVK